MNIYVAGNECLGKIQTIHNTTIHNPVVLGRRGVLGFCSRNCTELLAKGEDISKRKGNTYFWMKDYRFSYSMAYPIYDDLKIIAHTRSQNLTLSLKQFKYLYTVKPHAQFTNTTMLYYHSVLNWVHEQCYFVLHCNQFNQETLEFILSLE